MARRARSSRRKGRKTGKDKVRKEAKMADVQVKAETEKDVKSPPKDISKSTSGGGGAGFKEWFRQNQTTIFILLGIFVLALLIRSYFYYQISFDAWPPRIVGNDPSYHKRVIDFVQAEGHHPVVDGLLNYPLKGGNPRPPIFDWSIAIMGLVLAPFFGFNVTNSTWFVFQFAPTIWGALTIFPMYLLGKEAFGRKAGIMAAFFLAITSSHIERSTLGFTDHDSFVIFLVVLAMYFLSRSFDSMVDKNWVRDWRKPEDVILGFRSFFSENKEATGYSVLTGLSIAAIALTWQGYGYVMAILLIYFLVQLFIQRFRNQDSLGVFILILIALGITPLVSLPYYFVSSIAIWSQGFYIFLAMVVLGAFIVPTRDIPWLIVIPTLALFLVASYFILKWGFPTTANLLFTGGGYFVTNKLYSTIAEAQAPDLSRVVFTYGPATFFLGLIGVVMAFIKIPRNTKKDFIFIVIWTVVAIYMALSAIRFTFNATPAFALLAGWVIVETVRYFKAEGMSIVYSALAVLILFGLIGITYEGWENFFTDNYILLTVVPLAIGSVAYFAYMKYKRHRENFKFRSILTALTIAFVVIFPNILFAVDAGIPYEMKEDVDPNLEIFGSFGSSLHSDYWMDSYIWLSQQDVTMVDEEGEIEYVKPEDRPAFMSWWDYGFDQLLLGKHPTAADNFQNGYQFTGSVIASQNETEVIALMCARLIEGDWKDNGRDFSDDMMEVLEKHIGKDSNSTNSAQGLLDIYDHPGKYKNLVISNPDYYGNYVEITAPNLRYAAAKGVMMRLGEEGVVNLYRDVREVTGKSLRYFAVDYRLFPFSAQNTGIFYAPIKLADRDIDDYLEYKVYAQENTQGSSDNPEWTDYPDNPISMEKAEQESERLGYKFRVRNYEMYYTEEFYDSMFYRTYIGYSPADIGLPWDGKSVPGMQGDISNMPAMQGWNMTHWKLVYKTMYYSEMEEANASFPDDYEPLNYKEALDRYKQDGGDIKSGLGQGVFYLKYYDGAIVSGQVKTERGHPAPGVRVTVLDEYGIAHGNVITDEEGRYKVIAPPGDVSILATGGELENEYDRLYQFKIDQSTSQPVISLNYTQMSISDDQAMRRVDEGKIHKDLIISGKSVSGNVYWDIDESGSYEEEKDVEILEGYVTFSLSDYPEIEYGPIPINDEGEYSVSDLVTGEYTITYLNGEIEKEIITGFNVEPSTEATRDLKIFDSGVNGKLKAKDGTPGVNQTLILTSETGARSRLETDSVGNFSMGQLFPGIYSLEMESDLYTHELASFKVKAGEFTTVNITYYPASHLEISSITPGGREAGFSYEPSSGAIVKIVNVGNTSQRYIRILDEEGELVMDLPESTYVVQVTSLEKNRAFTDLATIDLRWNMTEELDMELDRAFRLNGTLTKLRNTPMRQTELMFTSKMKNLTTYAFTNDEGEYEVYLPKERDFQVLVDNVTLTGNVSYFHLQDIPSPGRSDKLVLNIWAEQSIEVNGQVYWDKDGNGEFTSPIEIGEMDDPGDLASEYALGNVTIEFQHENGTIEIKTGKEGRFTALLSSGVYEMRVNEPGFEAFTDVVNVEDTVANRNFGINGTDAPLTAENRRFILNISYDVIGYNEDISEPVVGGDITIAPTEAYLGEEILVYTTDEQGIISQSLTPGLYSYVMEYRYDSNGLEHHLWCSGRLFLDPSDKVLRIDVKANHTSEIIGRISYIKESLIRYPSGLVVNLKPVYRYGETIAGAETDEDGVFRTEAPVGYYVIEAYYERAGQQYVLLENFVLDDSFGERTFEMETAYTIDGYSETTFEGMENSYIQFHGDDVWLNFNLNDDGHFQAFLPKGEWKASFLFETSETVAGEDSLVVYYFNDTLEVDGPEFGVKFDINKDVLIRGSVYYDADEDRTILPEEKIPFANITFIPRDMDIEPITITADENGDYETLVPYTTLEIELDIEDYKADPKEGYEVLDLTSEETGFLWDISVEPRDSLIQGIVFYDKDKDGSYEAGEGFPNVRLEFESDEGEVKEVMTSEDGFFSHRMVPGSYEVSSFILRNGKPVKGFLGRIDVKVGTDNTTIRWKLVNAERFSGTLYLIDTDGNYHYEIDGEEPLEFISSKGPTTKVEVEGGTFTVDLPFYEYTVTTSLSREEYGMTMDYSLSQKLEINETTTPEDFSLRLEKEKDHSIEMDLIKDAQHEIEMLPGETVRIRYYVENIGNEPVVVTSSVGEKPESWNIELPFGRDIELGIGERIEDLYVNITAPREPEWDNTIQIDGDTDQDTRDQFQIRVMTPVSYQFEMGFDLEGVIGMDFKESKTVNLTIDNLGNGEDVVNLMMDPLPGDADRWGLEWEGTNEFPEEGENASMTPRGRRNYAITVTSPDKNSSAMGDSFTVSFTGVNRRGDVKETSITFKLAKPNLVLPQGFLKLTNRKLNDPVMNRTIEANISVMSKYNDANDVNVSLMVDGKTVAEGMISYIPQDGIASTRLRFNVSEYNITEDDFHSFEVLVDPYNTVDETEEDYDNFGYWDNVVIGEYEHERKVNWRIVIFVSIVILVTVGIIAYRQRTEPI